MAAVGDDPELRATGVRTRRRRRAAAGRHGRPRGRGRGTSRPRGPGAGRRRSSPARPPSCPCAGPAPPAGRAWRAGSARPRPRRTRDGRARAGTRPGRPSDVGAGHGAPGPIVVAAITVASRIRERVAIPAGATRRRPRTSVRPAVREPERDEAAEGVPGHEGALTPSASSAAAAAAAKSSIVAPRGSGASRRGRAGRPRAHGAVAAAPAAPRPAVLGRAAEPVDEQERLALAADVVADTARGPRLDAHCSRHPRKVSFVGHGDWGRGPIDSRDKRASDVRACLSAATLRPAGFSLPRDEGGRLMANHPTPDELSKEPRHRSAGSDSVHRGRRRSTRARSTRRCSPPSCRRRAMPRTH